MAPGRVKCVEANCGKLIYDKTQKSVKCGQCHQWWYLKCTDLSKEFFATIVKGSETLVCKSCMCDPLTGEVTDVHHVTSEVSEELNLASDTDTTLDSSITSTSTTVELSEQLELTSALAAHIKKPEETVTLLTRRVEHLERSSTLLSDDKKAVGEQTTQAKPTNSKTPKQKKATTTEAEMNEANLKRIQPVDPVKPVHSANFNHNVVTMKHGNIFDLAESKAIAHCIGADCLMTDGIAAIIKSKFKINSTTLKTLTRVGKGK